jgi:gas vesicle protein
MNKLIRVILLPNLYLQCNWIGAAIGAVGGLMAANSTAKAARKNAKTANVFTTEQMQNRHQWEVNDLRKAGLNPMLSAGAAPSIGSTAMAQTPDFSQAISQGANTGIQAIQTNANVDKIAQEISSLKTVQELNVEQKKKVATEIGLIKEQIRVQAGTAQGIELDNVQKRILTEYYHSDKAALVSKDLNVPPAKYIEMIEEYFEQLGAAAKGVGKSYYDSKLNPWNWFRD